MYAKMSDIYDYTKLKAIQRVFHIKMMALYLCYCYQKYFMPPEGAGEWRLHKKKLYKQYSHILKISYFREMCHGCSYHDQPPGPKI